MTTTALRLLPPVEPAARDPLAMATDDAIRWFVGRLTERAGLTERAALVAIGDAIERIRRDISAAERRRGFAPMGAPERPDPIRILRPKHPLPQTP